MEKRHRYCNNTFENKGRRITQTKDLLYVSRDRGNDHISHTSRDIAQLSKTFGGTQASCLLCKFLKKSLTVFSYSEITLKRELVAIPVEK